MKLTIRNIIAWGISRFLIFSGVARKAKSRALNGDYILSVYFHKPSRKKFEKSIIWLKQNGFNFLTTDDLEKIIKNEIPFPKGAAFLTVDDGWQSNEENIIAVAEKHEVPVTIFVSTEPVEQGAYWWSYVSKARSMNHPLPDKNELKKLDNEERQKIVDELKSRYKVPREALTVNQVKKAGLSPYITIGGHTHSHPILIKCSDIKVYEELKGSKIKLEGWTGKEVSTFAYPNGDYSEREIAILKQLDYRLAFGNNGQLLTRERLQHPYRIPRVGFLESASFAENICRILGIWKPLAIKLKSYFINI